MTVRTTIYKANREIEVEEENIYLEDWKSSVIGFKSEDRNG